jgi:hypothetical protein
MEANMIDRKHIGHAFPPHTYDKKGGSLEFVVLELNMHNQLDERVCKIRRSFIVQGSQSGFDGRSS